MRWGRAGAARWWGWVQERAVLQRCCAAICGWRRQVVRVGGVRVWVGGVWLGIWVGFLNGPGSRWTARSHVVQGKRACREGGVGCGDMVDVLRALWSEVGLLALGGWRQVRVRDGVVCRCGRGDGARRLVWGCGQECVRVCVVRAV